MFSFLLFVLFVVCFCLYMVTKTMCLENIQQQGRFLLGLGAPNVSPPQKGRGGGGTFTLCVEEEQISLTAW